MIFIKRYTPDLKNAWNDFVSQCFNASFMHQRGFMEYHSDRFEDFSLMVYDDQDLLACIPAHNSDKDFRSHRGLTYGGLLVKSYFAEQIDRYLDALIIYLKQKGFQKAEFNLPPLGYGGTFIELENQLKDSGFTIYRSLCSMGMNLQDELKISGKKSAGYRNGAFDAFKYVQSDDLELFWDDILIPSLKARHGSKPVHSLEEISLLKSRFPANIVLKAVYCENEMIAGSLFFIDQNVIKSQYAASNQKGFEMRAMDFLNQEAIKEFKNKNYRFFDFGTTQLTDGSINKGLKRYKSELGAKESKMNRLTMELY